MSDLHPGYRWIDWTPFLPEPRRGQDNGRTHGLAITRDGNLVVFRQADPAVLILSPEGDLLDAWGDRFLGAHGLTLVQDGDREALWLTDQDTAEVVKATLSGETLLQLERPDLPIYADRPYIPTWVAVVEERWGGNGDIWVTDGYSTHLIHRYDAEGRYLDSIDGVADVGGFQCSHGIWIDTRSGEPELYIADRGNKRLVVFTPEGEFKRTAGVGDLDSPCGGTPVGDKLYVAELGARISILDADDQLVQILGRNESVCEHPDWPNVPADHLHPGRFNSPHDLTVGPDGSIYVGEWIVGGRLTRLAPE